MCLISLSSRQEERWTPLAAWLTIASYIPLGLGLGLGLGVGLGSGFVDNLESKEEMKEIKTMQGTKR